MSNIKVAYFGHPGSFSFKAAKQFVAKKDAKAYFYPCQSAQEVMDYVLVGGAYGVLPTYNLSTGEVKEHSELVKEHKELVIDEIDLSVHHCLVAAKPLDFDQIKKVYSHPQALLQCAKYLVKNLKHAELVPYATTSTAAYDLARGRLPKNSAVVSSSQAAGIYKLKVLAANIEDNNSNTTRFKILFNK